MESKFVTISAVLVVLFALSYIQVSGTPIDVYHKPPNCPHGKCFIDRCKRICSCIPEKGNITCTKDTTDLKTDAGCVINTTEKDNCPLGKTYRSEVWPENFVCKCNNDTSQTYECIDLATKTYADATELAKFAKAGLYQNAKKEELVLNHWL